MDDMRRSWNDHAATLASDQNHDPRAVALVAAVTDVMAHEAGQETPEWANGIELDEPYFLWDASSVAARMLVMMQTHPAFMLRGVFVPRTILSRV